MINYESVLSEKVKEMQPSGIRKFFDLAATMEGVISLGVGEPGLSVKRQLMLLKENAWYTAQIRVWQI